MKPLHSLPAGRFLRPPQGSGGQCASTKHILEQGAKSLLPTACRALPAGLAHGEPPGDQGCTGGSCRAHPHSAPHKPTEVLPPPHRCHCQPCSSGHSPSIPGVKPFHLVRKRLAAGFTIPGVPVSPGSGDTGASRGQWPLGAAFPAWHSSPLRISARLCHSIFNCGFAELIFKPSLSRGTQPCKATLRTQYFHHPNIFYCPRVGN